jgi:hypothetical protein
MDGNGTASLLVTQVRFFGWMWRLPVYRQGHVFILDRVIVCQCDNKMGQQDGTAILVRLCEFRRFVSQDFGAFLIWRDSCEESYAQAAHVGDAVNELATI